LRASEGGICGQACERDALTESPLCGYRAQAALLQKQMRSTQPDPPIVQRRL